MESSRYRIEREVRPQVFLGVPSEGPGSPALLELIEWGADPIQAWQRLRQADDCERRDEGILCVSLLSHPGVQPQRDIFRPHHHVLRYVTESLRHSPSPLVTPASLGLKFREWLAPRRRLLAFAAGFGLVIAVCVLVLLPRESSVASRGEQPLSIASSSATPFESSNARTAPELEDIHQVVNDLIADGAADPLVKTVITTLDLVPGQQVSVFEQSRSGDIVLVAVASYSSTGMLKQATLELQRDVEGWRLRDVQPV